MEPRGEINSFIHEIPFHSNERNSLKPFKIITEEVTVKVDFAGDGGSARPAEIKA